MAELLPDPPYREPEPLTAIVRQSIKKTVIDPAPDAFATIEGLDLTKYKNHHDSFQKDIKGSDGARSKAKHEDAPLTAYSFFDVVEPPVRLEWLLRIYQESSVHYAAVQAKAANIVGLGYDLVDSQATRNKIDQIDDDSEALQKLRRTLQKQKFVYFDMLDNANDEADFSDTLQRVIVDYEVFGNAYIEIGRKANGQIGYIGHIPAQTIRVRRGRDGFVQMSMGKPQFFRNYGGDAADPFNGDPNPNEIIHLKKYHPSSTYYGLPDIIAADTELAGNKYAAAFNLEYFENKAIPKYVMVVSGKRVNPTVSNDMFEFFDSNFRGKNHRLLIVPVDTTDGDAKVTFQPIEAGVQDASFANYYKANVAGILMAHRVPITKIGTAEGVNVALAKDADKTFKEQVCRPTQRMIEKKVNKIIREFTNAFNFKLNELTLTDEQTQAEIDDIYLRSGTMVPNEVRARWGWPGLPWGDEAIQLSPQQKAEQAAQDNGTRERDAQRRRHPVDEPGNARNAAGEGRQTE